MSSSDLLFLNLAVLVSSPLFTPSWLSNTLAVLIALNAASRSAREPAATSSILDDHFFGGSGPQAPVLLDEEASPSEIWRVDNRLELPFLPRDPSKPPSPVSSPPAKSEAANPWTEAQPDAHEVSRRPPPPGVEVALRPVPAAAGLLAERSFLPVTEPIRSEGMGLAPRVGDGLGEAERSEAELPRRRARGRTEEDESESRAATAGGTRRVEGEGWAVEFIDALGVEMGMGTRPVTSARNNCGF